MTRPATRDEALPAGLPDGEVVLWQGAPDRKAVLRRALHARGAMAYFGLLSALSAGAALIDGRPLVSALPSVALIAASALAILLLGYGFSALVARTTRYTITTRRVVMRIGIALPITLNVPFAIVRGAGLKRYPDGTGDIPLALGGPGRISYLHLWPHARPWRVSRPEPMLRGVPDCERVAAILARAVGALSAETTSLVRVDGRPALAARRPIPVSEAA